MAWITDSLRSAIAAAVNPFQRSGSVASLPGVINFQLAYAAYQSSGMLAKVINIPAQDRVREWRDWQAEKPVIKAIEREEKRLGLRSKVQQAEVLRGIGGGALILAGPGDLAQPLTGVGKGGLAAVNVVSRWQLSLVDVDQNMASVTYGWPRMFRIQSGTGGPVDIHPSRVVCFRGEPLPAGAGVSDDERFWGGSRLMRVLREVENSDSAQRWFAELVRKAKLLRIGIPDLAEMVATDGGRQKLNARVATIAEGENVLNATVFSSAAKEGAGETISDYQVTWTGIPAMMDAFDQRVAAVSDIPFTRLMGRSPAGMNATGEYDDANWNKAVAAGQELETRPCLEQLDPLLIASAGVPAKDVTWRFAPLSKPSEKQEADTFFVSMQAIEKLQATAAIPDVAFTKGVQNWLSEREYLPGLDQALGELSEDVRFGLTADPDDTDPSASTQQEREEVIPSAGAGADGSVPRRRAANDARPRTLYVSRKVENVAEIAAWAKAQGLPELQDDLHVTIAYSTTAVDWVAMGSTWAGDDKGRITIAPGGPRVVEPLGNRTAVLMFASSDLSWRNREMREAGASWDWPDYQPHISLTGDPVDLASVEPYRGRIVLGPEVFEEIRDGND